MKKQQTQLQFLLTTLFLLFVSNVTAQDEAASSGAFDSYTVNNGWSWSIDDRNAYPGGEGFRWWDNGGRSFGDLLMQLKNLSDYTVSLQIPTTSRNAMFSLSANDEQSAVSNENVFPFLFLTAGDARSSIFYGKDNFLNFSINPKSPLNSSTHSYSKGFRFISSKGADITKNPQSYGKEIMRIQADGKVGIGTTNPNCELHLRGDFEVQSLNEVDNTWDNFKIHVGGESTHLISTGDENGMFLESKTGNKITIGDGDDTVFLQSRDIYLDYGTQADMIKVSINSDRHVEDAVLTVAGATYIGAKAGLAATGRLSKFNPEYLSRYSLWVEQGVVSEDFAFAGVKEWRDDVFDSGYDLMPLEKVKSYINQNKHLPDVPSGESVKEKGYTAHQMNMILLQKVEELTLYTISLNEEIKKLKEECAK